MITGILICTAGVVAYLIAELIPADLEVEFIFSPPAPRPTGGNADRGAVDNFLKIL